MDDLNNINLMLSDNPLSTSDFYMSNCLGIKQSGIGDVQNTVNNFYAGGCFPIKRADSSAFQNVVNSPIVSENNY